MIAQRTIDAVIEAADVVDVVGDYVNLKKRGANFLGLCPFHDEKTPSFNVSPTKQIYKCFGCGKAGNALNFIMEHEHYTYPEAIRFLAKKYNVEVEEEASKFTEEEKDERESLYIVLNYAQEYYAKYMHEDPAGKIGLAYLRERGFTDETINEFGLGYSPGGWDTFTKAALKAGYQKEILIKAGLIFETEDKKLFDRFRERVMFPIHSISGRVIGFGGRILQTKAKEAKYINTPETDIYHKSKILYGISQARKGIREQDNCLLVEGYTDVISLHQKGVQNVVASSGTSLTEDHVRLMKRYSENVVLVFDGDEAGAKASLRGIDIALKGGLNTKAVLLPQGEDPDSFAKSNTASYIRDFIAEESEDFLLFKARLIMKGRSNDPIEKAAIIREVISSVALIPDQLKRSLYIKSCARVMEVEERTLYNELNRQLANKTNSRNKDAGVELEAPVIPPEEEAQKAVSDTYAQEREVIKNLLLFGDRPFDEERLVRDYLLPELQGLDRWDCAACKKMFTEYYRLLEEGELGDTDFTHHTNPEIQKLAIDLTTQKEELSPNWTAKLGKAVAKPEHTYLSAVKESLAVLQLKRVMQMIRQNEEDMKAAKDEEGLLILLETHAHLTHMKQELSGKLRNVVMG